MGLVPKHLSHIDFASTRDSPFPALRNSPMWSILQEMVGRNPAAKVTLCYSMSSTQEGLFMVSVKRVDCPSAAGISATVPCFGAGAIRSLTCGTCSPLRPPPSAGNLLRMKCAEWKMHMYLFPCVLGSQRMIARPSLLGASLKGIWRRSWNLSALVQTRWYSFVDPRK